MTKDLKLELTKSELAMLITVLHMGGWHRKKNLPKHMRHSEGKFISTMSKIMKKLENSLEDD
jgi:uncharacterized membrane protein